MCQPARRTLYDVLVCLKGLGLTLVGPGALEVKGELFLLEEVVMQPPEEVVVVQPRGPIWGSSHYLP